MVDFLRSVLLLSMALVSPALFAGGTVLFMYDDQNEHHIKYVQQCEKAIHDVMPALRIIHQSLGAEAPATGKVDGRKLLVTVGAEAAVQSGDSDWPVLHTLITQRRFESLSKTRERPRTAIYLEQSVSRQLALIRSALPSIKSVNVLLGRESSIYKPELTAEVRRQGLTPKYIVVADDKELTGLFEDGTLDADSILLVPDPVVVNRRTVKTLVLGSYHRGIPLVGYSQALVKAGALMAVHSPLEAQQQQMVEVVTGYMKNRRLPEPGPTDDYAVAVNYQLARALKVSLPEADELKHQMQGGSR